MPPWYVPPLATLAATGLLLVSGRQAQQAGPSPPLARLAARALYPCQEASGQDVIDPATGGCCGGLTCHCDALRAGQPPLELDLQCPRHR
jgi:hypothetical protein